MKKMALAIFAAILTLSACTTEQKKPEAVSMANPASVYCTQNGGTLTMKKDTNGSETGICTFANGKSCEEWAFYRKECSNSSEPRQPVNVGMANPASVHCINNGGTLSIKKDAKGAESGVCTFANGKSCDDWAFYRKECSGK